MQTPERELKNGLVEYITTFACVYIIMNSFDVNE